MHDWWLGEIAAHQTYNRWQKTLMSGSQTLHYNHSLAAPDVMHIKMHMQSGKAIGKCAGTDLLAKFVMKTTEGVFSRNSSVMLISSWVRWVRA